MPASLGEMNLHTPMLPCRMAWPAASSRKKRGMPTTNISTTYSKRNAPEEEGETSHQVPSLRFFPHPFFSLLETGLLNVNSSLKGQCYCCISLFWTQTFGYFVFGPCIKSYLLHFDGTNTESATRCQVRR